MKKAGVAKRQVTQVFKADMELMAREAYDKGFTEGARKAREYWQARLADRAVEASRLLRKQSLYGVATGFCFGLVTGFLLGVLS